MPILRIQHLVQSFEGWKRAFDGDPNFVMIDLEFDAVADAERMLERLRTCGPGGAVMRNPEAWIVGVSTAAAGGPVLPILVQGRRTLKEEVSEWFATSEDQ